MRRGYLAMWAMIFVGAAIAFVVTPTGRLLTFAGTLLILIGIAHSVAGERFILSRVFRRELPRLLGSEELMRQTLRFAWHLTSIAWWGAGAVLLAAADGSVSGAAVVRLLGLTAAASAVISFIVARGRHLSWTVFLAIAIATWTAASQVR